MDFVGFIMKWTKKWSPFQGFPKPGGEKRGAESGGQVSRFRDHRAACCKMRQTLF